MYSRGTKRPSVKFTVKEKFTAVMRVHKDGQTKASVARDMGVPESTLRGWCKNVAKITCMARTSTENANEHTSNINTPAVTFTNWREEFYLQQLNTRQYLQRRHPCIDSSFHSMQQSPSSSSSSMSSSTARNSQAQESLLQEEPEDLSLPKQNNVDEQEEPEDLSMSKNNETRPVVEDLSIESDNFALGEMSENGDDAARDLTESEALKHARILLEWVESHEPSATAEQIQQFRMLIDNMQITQ